MVGLAVRQAKHAFLEDGIFAIPQSYAETQQLPVIADTGQPVFAPVISSGPRLVMREVVPGIAVLAVVFADSSPLPLAKVGSPFSPRFLADAYLLLGPDSFECACLLESG